MNSKVSVVILNWLRPNNIIHHILPELIHIPEVNEIIISHGRPDTYFDNQFPNQPIIHRRDFEKNKVFGLSLRFLAALQSSNPYIVFIDDDVVPLSNTISNMVQTLIANYPCIVSKDGRNCTFQTPYDTHNINSLRLPIALTRLLVLHKSLIDLFWEKQKYIFPYVSRHSQPLWNGEDIFLSLLAYFIYKKKAYICQSPKLFPIKNLNTINDLKVAISQQNNHYQYRNKLVQEIFKMRNHLESKNSP